MKISWAFLLLLTLGACSSTPEQVKPAPPAPQYDPGPALTPGVVCTVTGDVMTCVHPKP